jgi:hypothetical protein
MRYPYLLLLCLAQLVTQHLALGQGGIRAGQVSGNMYIVRPTPPVRFTCNGCNAAIDLNGDGVVDLDLLNMTAGGSPPCSYFIHGIDRKMTGLEFAYQGPIIRMVAGDSISSTTQWQGQPIQWVGTGFTYLSTYSKCYGGPGGGGPGTFRDYWGADTLTRYIGMRWKTTPTAAYQYGWLRIKGTGELDNNRNYYAIAYAGQRVVLANRKVESLAVALYPNPVTDRLTVELPTAVPAHLELRDLAGRLIQQHTFPAAAKVHTLSLVDLPAGVYLVQVNTPAGSVVRRISKL